MELMTRIELVNLILTKDAFLSVFRSVSAGDR